jgi:hypothetical protein
LEGDAELDDSMMGQLCLDIVPVSIKNYLFMMRNACIYHANVWTIGAFDGFRQQ